MWELRRLTNLWISMACYRDSLFFLCMLMMNITNITINLTVWILFETFWSHSILKITFSFVFLDISVTSVSSELFSFQSSISCKECTKLPQFIVLSGIWGWLWTGYESVNGFIDHLYTPLGTTSNYSVIVNLHTLQITTTPAKLFQSAVSSSAVPWQW
jgi:hypothetical protein